MSTQHPNSPRDEDIDTLLARRYRDTSPAFEARWVALKRDLRTEPQQRSQWTWPGWGRWMALSGALVVAVILGIITSRYEPPPVADHAEPSAVLAELFAMDEVLGRATVLLDEESRAALLHLPVEPQSRI